jgi:hypothetical protein
VFKLKETIKTSDESPIVGKRTRYKNLNLAVESGEGNDLKMARSVLHLSEPSQTEQESVRKKTLADLLSIADRIVNGGSAEGKFGSDVSRRLGSLDYYNIRAIYRGLSEFRDRSSYQVAR